MNTIYILVFFIICIYYLSHIHFIFLLFLFIWHTLDTLSIQNGSTWSPEVTVVWTVCSWHEIHTKLHSNQLIASSLWGALCSSLGFGCGSISLCDALHLIGDQYCSCRRDTGWTCPSALLTHLQSSPINTTSPRLRGGNTHFRLWAVPSFNNLPFIPEKFLK